MELILERNNRFIKLWLQFFFSVVIHPSLKLDLFWRKVLEFSFIDQTRALFHHVYFDGPRQTQEECSDQKLAFLFSFSLSLLSSTPSSNHLSLFFNPSPPLCQSVSIRCDSRMCVFITFSEHSPLADQGQFCLVTNSRESEWQRHWTIPFSNF